MLNALPIAHRLRKRLHRLLISGLIAAALLCGVTSALRAVGPAAGKLTNVVIQDFQSDVSEPTTWVANMPDGNAAASLSNDQPFEGKRDLRVHYHFTGKGTEYFGVNVPVQVQAPIHTLAVNIAGDQSGVGYGLYLIDASGKTHKYRSASTMRVNFTGWKSVRFDLDSAHESWGGAADGRIDLPISKVTFEISTPGQAVEGNLYFAKVTADSEGTPAETASKPIVVLSPDSCSDVHGDTIIRVSAPGYKIVTAHCWKAGGAFGADAVVAKLTLDEQGQGSFVLPAEQFPHGPICVTLSGQNQFAVDHCYLQLYNTGGAIWNAGLPEAPPPARRMPLVFADDFVKLPTIGPDIKATYYDHKPPNGSQDFSSIPFTDFKSKNNPFSKRDTYLRIRADSKKNSAGLLCSVHNDGSGIKVNLPCYFECRLMGPNAIGTWPAFWLLTDNLSPSDVKGVDELDIIEAYGGEGPGHPNSYDAYQITPHCWNQGDAGAQLGASYYKMMNNPTRMHHFGVPSTWYETFHTYGCRVTTDTTTYFCDNIELGHHPTTPICKVRPLYFLINLATGGGWPVDLSRCNGKADLYVDFVRVYGQK